MAAPAEASSKTSTETGFLSQLLRGDLVASALDHDIVLGAAAKTPSGRTAALPDH